jgi:HlyD family secretion protein
MEIISLDEIWVSAWVDETAISKVAAGQMARIVFRSESDKNYPGKWCRASGAPPRRIARHASSSSMCA